MSVLIIVAHPDDEVLGCGGTAALLAARGIKVHSCILSGRADARQNRPSVQALLKDTRQAQSVLGLEEPIIGKFQNIHFNVVPHLELVQFIEQAIIKTSANHIFTHHPADLNNDHHQVSLASQAAARLSQRCSSVLPLKGLYFMEILSATDWAFPGSGSENRPDTFVEIGELRLNQKLKALKAYRGVMRDFPHPRSEEIIRGLAAYRGGQAGMRYAEAFHTAFRAMDVSELGDG